MPANYSSHETILNTIMGCAVVIKKTVRKVRRALKPQSGTAFCIKGIEKTLR